MFPVYRETSRLLNVVIALFLRVRLHGPMGVSDKTFTARGDIIHGVDLERLCGSLENISRTLQRKFPRSGKFPHHSRRRRRRRRGC